MKQILSCIYLNIGLCFLTILLTHQKVEAITLDGKKVKETVDKITPDHMELQTAGYMGEMGFGIGYEPTSWYDVGLVYGYSRKSTSGREVISWTWKNTFLPYTFPIGNGLELKPTAGVGLIYGQSPDLFAVLPQRYPRKYYAPTAIRYYISAGAKVVYEEKHALFMSLNYLDTELTIYYFNRDWIDFETLGSLALGYQYFTD